MQFHLFSGFFIFIGSYLPLALILAIQDIPWSWWSRPLCTVTLYSLGKCDYVPFENPWLAIPFIFISLGLIFFVNYSFGKLNYPFNINVVQFKPIPNELINYTFPYVVSFMGISYAEPQKLIGFLVFLVWMFSITYKSGQILMNPLLLMFKWRLYEVSLVINGAPREVRALGRGVLSSGSFKSQTVQDFYIIKD